MEDKLLIGVSGKMRHGKDTVGDHLIAKYGFRRLSFADKVKEICMNYDNSTPTLRKNWNERIATEVLDDGTLANEVDAAMQRICPGVWQKLTHDDCYGDKPKHARLIMQKFATDEMRRLSPDCWVRVAMRQYEQSSGRWVVTDLRFKNEAYQIEAAENSQLWRVIRPIPKQAGAGHRSEIDLDDYPFEVFIDNDSTIAALHKRVDKIMKRVLKGTRPFAIGEEVY